MKKHRLFLVLAVILPALHAVSCRQSKDEPQDELAEAGYEMTVGDWMRAAAAGEMEVMRRFLAAGMEVDGRNDSGDTALHVAAGEGREEVAKFLLDRGMAVDIEGGMGRTPLMAAVLGDRPMMVRWLLRQGADPALRDGDRFSPLMLAARDGHSAVVAELATYSRGELDSALLLAALVGNEAVIDELTNYGASGYSRMDDGRTPLMVAAENGHAGAVELLMDIGSSRFSTADDGRTAAQHALDAGFPEIAMLVTRGVERIDLSLDSEQQVAEAMTEWIDAASTEAAATGHDGPAVVDGGVAQDAPTAGETAVALDGAVVTATRPAAAGPDVEADAEVDVGTAGGVVVGEASPAATTAPPPLVMRRFQQRELPVELRHVDADTATITIHSETPRQVAVPAGGMIPETSLQVVRVARRMEAGKLNHGEPIEVAVVEVRDTRTGVTREWLSGRPASSHDPVALVEDAATGRRFIAAPGQRFSATDGSVFSVTDVRPNQLVITEEATGVVHTLPLRGPRG